MITAAWILALIGILLDAYSDAILDKNKKRNHLTEVLSVSSYFASALLFGMFVGFTTIGQTLIGLLVVLFIIASLRLGTFNIAYNHFMGVTQSHLGTTSEIDKLLDKLPNLLVIFIYWASTLSSLIVSAMLSQLW